MVRITKDCIGCRGPYLRAPLPYLRTGGASSQKWYDVGASGIHCGRWAKARCQSRQGGVGEVKLRVDASCSSLLPNPQIPCLHPPTPRYPHQLLPKSTSTMPPLNHTFPSDPMAPVPGLLYVTMAPAPSLPTAQFHDWYNNEHGPTRLRLPFITNGFRYRATNLPSPSSAEAQTPSEWMALYDITNMAELTKETYTRLREDSVKSQREKDTMRQIKVDRKLLDFVEGWDSPLFRKLEDVEYEGEGNVIVAVSSSLHPGRDKKEELDRWYREEHVEMLSRVPGWLRTRRYVTSSIERKPEDQLEYLALHEYAPKNGLGGKEFQTATTTPWNDLIWSKVVSEKRRRTWELYYTFGPAPRDLTPLASADAAPFEAPDRRTRTWPSSSSAHRPAIESYINTKDEVVLPYRLEGSPDPDAPLIILSNSILVDWGIWDGFVTSFFSVPENRNYRILRYHTRGRSRVCGEQPVNLDVLAEDIVTLLDALRIPKAAAAIGVSLGGATVLNAALKYPEMIASLISCDTSAKAPEGNKKTWGDRIAIAEKEGATNSAGEKVVGEQLTEMTVRRWFVKESYDEGNLEKEMQRVKQMVQNNSLEGFKRSVEALWEYDVRSDMKDYKGKGAFVVGAGDGVLPGTMKEMATSLGNGAECHVIDHAGHLPMVERPEEFARVVTSFMSDQR